MKPTIVFVLLLTTLGLAKEAPHEAYAKTVAVKALLKTTTTSEAKPLVFPADSAEVTGIEVTIPAGGSTGWHTHAFSGFAYVVAGKLQVTTPDSTRRVYTPGQAFAEVVNTPHEGTALGAENVRLIAFFTTQKGKPVSIKQ